MEKTVEEVHLKEINIPSQQFMYIVKFHILSYSVKYIYFR